MDKRARLPSLLCLTTLLIMTLGLASAASAIVNGFPDGNRHPYVGVVEYDFGGQVTLRCSGTLIAPTVFVSAAHCVGLFGTATTAKVSFDSEVTDNSVWIPATDFYTHPEFCLACGRGFPRLDTHDVAVIILSLPVTDKGFGRLPSIGLIETLATNTSVTVVGYGAVGTSKGKPPHAFQYDSLRHYAVSYVTQNKGVLSEEFVQLSGNPGNGKGGACVGDSGGPVLLGSTNTVLATTTLGTGRNCIGIQYSYRLDTQSAQDFITPFL